MALNIVESETVGKKLHFLNTIQAREDLRRAKRRGSDEVASVIKHPTVGGRLSRQSVRAELR